MIILRKGNFEILKEKEPLDSKEEIFSVTIIDNNYNTYEQVIRICMKALNISYSEAYHIALAVDNNGMCEVLQANKSEAEHVAEIIRTIGIEVRVAPVL